MQYKAKLLVASTIPDELQPASFSTKIRYNLIDILCQFGLGVKAEKAAKMYIRSKVNDKKYILSMKEIMEQWGKYTRQYVLRLSNKIETKHEKNLKPHSGCK